MFAILSQVIADDLAKQGLRLGLVIALAVKPVVPGRTGGQTEQDSRSVPGPPSAYF
jgi:hypothetical protein